MNYSPYIVYPPIFVSSIVIMIVMRLWFIGVKARRHLVAKVGRFIDLNDLCARQMFTSILIKFICAKERHRVHVDSRQPRGSKHIDKDKVVCVT